MAARRSPEAAQTVGADRLREAGDHARVLRDHGRRQRWSQPASSAATLLIACAATVDGVRLIDNLTVSANREAATANR